MLITKEVEIRLSGRSIKHYTNLGYDIPKRKTKDGMRIKNGQMLLVKIEDVPKQSHIDVIVKCDICGIEYPTRYDGYNTRKENDINYDCCEDCKSIKNKELNILRYGVENQFQRQEVKDKSKQTCIEKFGFDYAMKNKDIQAKSIKNMALANGVEASAQQVFINDVLNGKLNYVDETTKFYVLDIAFPDINTFIEYDGSGHDLQVKFKNLTREEFEAKEIQRSTILRRNNWKEIKIISNKDRVPTEDKIKSIFDFALNHINNNHSWIEFNIDLNTYRTSLGEFYYDFGVCKIMRKKVAV